MEMGYQVCVGGLGSCYLPTSMRLFQYFSNQHNYTHAHKLQCNPGYKTTTTKPEGLTCK